MLQEQQELEQLFLVAPGLGLKVLSGFTEHDDIYQIRNLLNFSNTV